MERMLRKKKDNSDYEIDREFTGKFAIEKNAEYQDRIAELEEENKVIKEEKEMLIRQNTLLQESNKKLKEENENLKAIIEHYKKFEEGKNELEGMLMEEDTLQELKDIGEI